MKRKLDFIFPDDGAAYARLDDVLDNLVDSARVQKRLHLQVSKEPSILKMQQGQELYANCDQLGAYIAATLRDAERLDPARCEAVVNELLDEADPAAEDDGQDPVELMNCLVNLYQAVKYTDGPFHGVVLEDIKRYYGHIQNLVNIKEQKKSLD